MAAVKGTLPPGKSMRSSGCWLLDGSLADGSLPELLLGTSAATEADWAEAAAVWLARCRAAARSAGALGHCLRCATVRNAASMLPGRLEAPPTKFGRGSLSGSLSARVFAGRDRRWGAGTATADDTGHSCSLVALLRCGPA
jgi:hypothetical protein